MAGADENRWEGTLGWLLLTDLHIGQPREAGRVSAIEQAFCDDLDAGLTVGARDGGTVTQPIDVVFFTGDIAFKGEDAEYLRATAMLGRLLERVQRYNAGLGYPAELCMPVLCPVPGNHDLARPADPEVAEQIRAAFRNRTPYSKPLWQGAPALVRTAIEKSFAAYRRWLRQPLPFAPVGDRRLGLLPGDSVCTIRRNGVRLGVLGLNSAWLHLGDEDDGRLHLDVSQVTHLIGPSPSGWIGRHDLTVLLTHHPPRSLSPVAQQLLAEEIRPSRMIDLHLYGHAHLGRHDPQPGVGGIRHHVEGRSLFGAEEGEWPRLHGYTAGRFILGESRREAEIWARRGWSGGDGWRFGPAREGHGRWRLVIDFGPSPSQGTALEPTLARMAEGLGRRDGSADWPRTPTLLPTASEGERHREKWVFLSASVPRPHDDPERRAAGGAWVETARPSVIRETVRQLVEALDREGVGLIFGGHPSIIAPVAAKLPELRRVEQAGTSPIWLILVQSDRFLDLFVDEVGVMQATGGVRCVLHEGGLDAMRRCMARLEGLVGSVYLGGLEGIAEEFASFGAEAPDLPRIALGLGGGRAAELLLDPSTAAAAAGAVEGQGIAQIEAVGRLWHTPQTAVQAIVEHLGITASGSA